MSRLRTCNYPKVGYCVHSCKNQRARCPIVGHLMSDNGEYAQVAYHKDNEMRFAMGRIMDWNPVKEVKEGKK